MVAETYDFKNREHFVEVDQLDFGEEEENGKTKKKDQMVVYSKTDVIEKVIELSLKFLKKGKFAFKDVAEALGNIVGVGGIVKEIMKFIPDEPNPIFERLATLESKIDELNEKMNAKFDDLKAFITELNFYVEVMNPASNLMKLMMDCMKHPSEEGVENFIAAYKKNPPLIFAYSVLSLLERKSTNPLKMAMDADPFKTTTTFNKWFDIISGVLGEFLFLEAFGSGLLEKHNDYNSHRIIEKSDHLFRKMEEWKEEYKKNNHNYWGLLDEYARDYLRTNEKLNNAKKADHLAEFLATIITDDAFYLGVFNHWKSNRYLHYTYQNFHPEDFIEILETTETNVFIFKSTAANSVGQEWMAKLTKLVEDVQFDVREFRESYKDYPQKVAKKISIVVSFICIMGGLQEEIRGVNCKWNDGRPGWNRIMKSQKDKEGHQAYRALIAAW